MTNLSLAVELAQASARASGPQPCKACEYLSTMSPGVEKDQVSGAMAGTIGVNKLAAILRRHNIPVGRRSIERHRAHLREA